MKLVKANYNIIETGYTLNDIYKTIELAGRNCYKSENKITETSAKSFVDKIINLGHTSVLEHGTLYLDVIINDIQDPEYFQKIYIINQFRDNKYSKVADYLKEHSIGNTTINVRHYAITTNYRVFIEQFNWQRFAALRGTLENICDYTPEKEYVLQFLTSPTEHHHKRLTINWLTSIGISREFCRHRVFSFSEESTRYCNYSLDKFDNGVTFIHPLLDESESENFNILIKSYEKAEADYLELLEKGCSPQTARNVLPLNTKTSLIMTGFVDDWKEFFKLRTALNAHPEARELATKAKEQLILNNYLPK